MGDFIIRAEENVSSEDEKYFYSSFRAYNESIIGKQEAIPVNIILYNSHNEVIGGVNATIVWGWININNLWLDKNYRGNGLGNSLLIAAENKAVEQGIIKSSIGTFLNDAVLFLQSQNYTLAGTLADRPRGYTYCFLKNENITERPFSLDGGYYLKSGNDLSTEDLNTLSEKIQKDQIEILGEIPFKPIRIFARDSKEKIVGGLTGYIGWDWLYISVLWTDESYRGQGIGKKLMNKAEDMSLEFGINNSFLGTTEFQAREFYEKLGYEIFSVTDDLPPGFKNFSMKKKLK